MAAGHLDYEVAQAPWMVSESGDDPRAAGRALLMQVIDAGDGDVGSGGGVDGGSRKIVNLEVGPAAQELGHRPMLWPLGSPNSAHCRVMIAEFEPGSGASCRSGMGDLPGG